MENIQDRGVWIRFVLRGWIRIRSISDRIRNPGYGARCTSIHSLSRSLWRELWILHISHMQERGLCVVTCKKESQKWGRRGETGKIGRNEEGGGGAFEEGRITLQKGPDLLEQGEEEWRCGGGVNIHLWNHLCRQYRFLRHSEVELSSADKLNNNSPHKTYKLHLFHTRKKYRTGESGAAAGRVKAVKAGQADTSFEDLETS